jgi:aryl-alcohol dehydrogenase-like predicted oxidoreductase
MRARELGDGLAVSAIGFGAMVLSPGMYGEVDEERGLAALDHAIRAGATFVDTADAYGGGANEELVGRATAGRRDEVVLATKFGLNVPEGVATRAVPVGYGFGELRVNAGPANVRRYLEASLRRLGTDRVDLYYPHFPDPAVPIEDTVAAVAELVGEGLVGHVGLSNVTAGQLERAARVHPIAAVQVEWSLWNRGAEDELLPLARRLGVGLVAWGPLGNGFLAGEVREVGEDDFRRHAPRFQGENLARNRDRFAPLRRIAEEAGVTPAQLALAWLLARDGRAVPIPGSRTPAHIDENLAAAGVALDAETLARVDEASATVEAVGGTLL